MPCKGVKVFFVLSAHSCGAMLTLRGTGHTYLCGYVQCPAGRLAACLTVGWQALAAPLVVDRRLAGL